MIESYKSVMIDADETLLIELGHPVHESDSHLLKCHLK